MRNRLLVVIISLLVFTSSVFAVQYPRVTLNIAGPTGPSTGNIVIELYPDKAPVTVVNFINYVKSNFYNGLIFHRVISGFMIQGGGFDTNLVEKAAGSAIINESSNRLSNLRGTIAMARTYQPDSATSQFFINLANNTFLDYETPVYDQDYNAYSKIGYCVFGQVVSGMSIVDAIAALPTTTKNGMTDVPVNNVVIQSATVTLNAPVCQTPPEGDLDGDCKVSFKDVALMSQHWLDCNSILPTCN